MIENQKPAIGITVDTFSDNAGVSYPNGRPMTWIRLSPGECPIRISHMGIFYDDYIAFTPATNTENAPKDGTELVATARVGL